MRQGPFVTLLHVFRASLVYIRQSYKVEIDANILECVFVDALLQQHITSLILY